MEAVKLHTRWLTKGASGGIHVLATPEQVTAPETLLFAETGTLAAQVLTGAHAKAEVPED